ncbi:adhesin [Deinococcus sp. KSM4-11]|uniref:metal ABC transporter solute-binding protein, Zn/Mn family n=1 Tax=Deinococcus sp. KSM4-11 TaxID=2568654 RepID=UPI0010A41971|nr:zinc ABC transporter substrate-binding protein [Deinococcus sp. KSM4-11]THF86286.1 adhesin [Deinococcus sp. KSM4-11]
MTRTLLSLAVLLGASLAHAAPLPVTATTSILADFVKNVGGLRVTVTTIVPAGTDAHTFQPTTTVIRQLAGSRLLFLNGANLEPWLPQVQAANPGAKAVILTTGLPLRPAPGESGSNGPRDPHAWWDVTLTAGYIRTIQMALSAADPAGKATYAQNAAAYLKQLDRVDAWAKTQFATLKPAQKTIVTNHDALAYFAAHYGLTLAGTVLPGLSTEREPSARELAALITSVRGSGAKVIFTENTVNDRLARTLASETGAKIAPPLYTDALGPQGSRGDTFLKALRANVDIMVRALK